MAVRILIMVAVLMALYGCGLSPETKDSSEGLEPLGSEASVFGAVALTGQNVELEVNVVELADRPGLLLASVYLECGYAMGGPCEDSYPPSYLEFLLDTKLGLVVLAVLLLLVFVAAVLAVIFLIYYLIYLIRWLLSENRLNRLGSVLTAGWLGTAWIGVGVLFFLMVVVPGALLIYRYSGIGD